MSHDHLRVAPIEPGTRPELKALEDHILHERGRISLLYQVLLNSKTIATGWEALLTAVRYHTSVPADLREMIILRVAILNRAPYEFEAHVPHALKGGLSQEKIDALRLPGIAPCFNDTERLILQFTDHSTRDVEVPAAVMDELTRRYSPGEVIELVATVGAYNMVSRLLVALNLKH